MTNILLYGPQGSGKTRVAAHVARAFGLQQVIDQDSEMIGIPDEGALIVCEASTSAARNLAAAYGLRTMLHVKDALLLAPWLIGQTQVMADPVTGQILKGNADLTPEEQRAVEAAQVNLRG
ncbi:hypothetical protein WCE55_02320 [Luteimonas sp. MJ293]|uniref:hypothetical protein n=1 Tax=Luteimonas sp. MJ146 TaxID=3129240 RepID=UPI0031BB0AB1